jgi:deoxyribonuclease V
MFNSWNVSPAAAINLQTRLAPAVVCQNRLGPVKTVAGVDVAIKDDLAQAAVVVLSYPELEPVDAALASRPVTFPYIPGLLSFREGPVILAALAHLDRSPDLLIFDDQGIAHPRRLGLASHIGLLADLPSIGCAKSRLCGTYGPLAAERGSSSFLMDGAERIGAAVRTRRGVKPVFVSIGHRIDLSTSIEYILRCCRRYRLPEPIRWAHQVAGGARPPPTRRGRGDKPA